MSALTVKELIEQLGRVQPERVVMLRITDQPEKGTASRCADDVFTLVDHPSILLKNAHPINGGCQDAVEINLMVSVPH